jgi:uncharacterized repeat protein (TIGR03803 family)
MRIPPFYNRPGLLVPAFLAALAGCSSNAPIPGAGLERSLDAASPSKVQDVVADFQPADANPYGGLLLSTAGVLFGTSASGGSTASGGFGSVFSYNGTDVQTLYTFQGMPDGAAPEAGLVEDAKGVLYGTTTYGGAVCPAGCGTVFDLVPDGMTYSENVLYSFKDGKDGAYPIAGLLIDKSGALYGTTFQGGASTSCNGGCGIAFKLGPSAKKYKETVLHRFSGGQDGANPVGTMIADSAGDLYGTSKSGGSSSQCSGGCGVVYKLKPSGAKYVETIVHSFAGGSADGANPRSGLVAGKNSVLYGTTLAGSGTNKGVVFALTPSGSSYTESVIHQFKGGTDGAQPHNENGLVVDTNGNLYGTTSAGGSAESFGTVFKLSTSNDKYKETVLYRFQGAPNDGQSPWASVIFGSDEKLWGVTPNGGSGNCTSSIAGCGVLFRVNP